jgi:hypothetical protein
MKTTLNQDMFPTKDSFEALIEMIDKSLPIVTRNQALFQAIVIHNTLLMLHKDNK